MNWIFRKRFVQNVGKTNATAFFPGTRRFRGKEGDNVLIAEDFKDQLRFTQEYKISSVIQYSEEEKQTKVNLYLITKFEDEKLLTDYMYSLYRISRFDNPKIHFRRRYSKLSNREYSVIVNDNIFYERTILGTILDSMPREHQMEFSIYCAERGIGFLENVKDYGLLLNMLSSYLDYSVKKPSRYLQESYEMPKSIIGKELPTSFGFADNIDVIGPTSYQIVSQQVEVLSSNLLSLNEIQDYGRLSDEMRSSRPNLQIEKFKIAIPTRLKE